ncbi:protein kinase C-binding protein 1-like isoform 2 [Dinothrombium tinctorium]|uniref:Protein kinase C-binding protein 1-like isoform 2 n=1 Tax=Dinothrombium tinctorium TaxID=1965070 RepID=A0A443QFV0_9ACAR|nr:protein kinase C-binding protein 1-like isoform 2 [Dinothrombium tinctorium]
MLNWVVWHINTEINIYSPFVMSLECNTKSLTYKYSEEMVIEAKRWYARMMQEADMNKPSLMVFKNIHDIIVREVEDFQICPDCFALRHRFKELGNDWFNYTCSKPHILVYAKLGSHPFWPAKVMKYDGQKEVLCRFFGSHDCAFVPINRCVLLSEEYPDKEPSTKNYFTAKSELCSHIRKIKCRFPLKFRYAPRDTPLNPNNLFMFDEPLFCQDNKDLSGDDNDCDNKEYNTSFEDEECDERTKNEENEIVTTLKNAEEIKNFTTKLRKVPQILIQRNRHLDQIASHLKRRKEQLRIETQSE